MEYDNHDDITVPEWYRQIDFDVIQKFVASPEGRETIRNAQKESAEFAKSLEKLFAEDSGILKKAFTI